MIILTRMDPHKAPDSRYIHRGVMNWELAAKSDNPRTVEGQAEQTTESAGEDPQE